MKLGSHNDHVKHGTRQLMVFIILIKNINLELKKHPVEGNITNQRGVAPRVRRCNVRCLHGALLITCRNISYYGLLVKTMETKREIKDQN